jgi:hypothetical protein
MTDELGRKGVHRHDSVGKRERRRGVSRTAEGRIRQHLNHNEPPSHPTDFNRQKLRTEENLRGFVASASREFVNGEFDLGSFFCKKLRENEGRLRADECALIPCVCCPGLGGCREVKRMVRVRRSGFRKRFLISLGYLLFFHLYLTLDTSTLMSSLLRATTRRRVGIHSSRSFNSSVSSQFLSRPRPALSGLPIDISPEVQQAQAEGRPIVALESTLITHGELFQHSIATSHVPHEREECSRVQILYRSTTTSFILTPERM